jgi:hypothetical protein
MRRALPANQRRVGRNLAIARSSSARPRPATMASIEPWADMTGMESSAGGPTSSRGPSIASQ